MSVRVRIEPLTWSTLHPCRRRACTDGTVRCSHAQKDGQVGAGGEEGAGRQATARWLARAMEERTASGERWAWAACSRASRVGCSRTSATVSDRGVWGRAERNVLDTAASWVRSARVSTLYPNTRERSSSGKSGRMLNA